ncbi:hypothetical protein CCACVL1_11003 [Corchorus capsularis]|uniref:Uncharacterized protein n=1 Tax=Corchorus capsularis TaxID=210143 RepID=A0A1R3IND7_COCAP|nr:hypothetical protein CCACVL1_11003 [Corchorus capsularis]
MEFAHLFNFNFDFSAAFMVIIVGPEFDALDRFFLTSRDKNCDEMASAIAA